MTDKPKRTKEHILVSFDLQTWIERMGITKAQLSRQWGKSMPTIIAWCATGRVSPMVVYAAKGLEVQILKRRQQEIR